jgi:ubiquinone biosynthesis protein
MQEQVGWKAFVRAVQQEAPYWASTLPKLPRLAHRLLADERLDAFEQAVHALARENARRNQLLLAMLVVAVAAFGAALVALL